MNIEQLKQHLNNRLEAVQKCYNEMLRDVGNGIKVIDVTGLSRKEKAEVTNKRNCLLVQEHCYQEILDLLEKGE